MALQSGWELGPAPLEAFAAAVGFDGWPAKARFLVLPKGMMRSIEPVSRIVRESAKRSLAASAWPSR